MPASCPSSSTRRSSRRARIERIGLVETRSHRASRRLDPHSHALIGQEQDDEEETQRRDATQEPVRGLEKQVLRQQFPVDQEHRGQQQRRDPGTKADWPGNTACRTTTIASETRYVARLLPTSVVATNSEGWLLRNSRPRATASPPIASSTRRSRVAR